jgi:putative transposase
MPRTARFRIPGYPVHVIQRGNNRSACFVRDKDRILYLALLEELSRSEHCPVHAYVFMTNHVHLLVTPGERDSLSELMRKLGQRYVQHFNRVHRRTGGLWEGRFRSCLVDSQTYFLRCHRYIELNPVRAGMVQRPSEHVWSSYRVNALGESSSLIEPHSTYLALGRDPAQRRTAYRYLFKADLTNAELTEIRVAANSGFALGSKAFIAELERISGRRAAKARVREAPLEICP